MADKKLKEIQQPNIPSLLKPVSSKQPIVHTAGKVGKSHHEFFKVMNQQQQPIAFRKITAEELSHHNTL
jgi:hypothetical protein